MMKEKIVAKVKKVLELSKNNPNEQEAQAAALKAQALMMQYHLSMEDIEDETDSEEIAEYPVHVGSGNKWKGLLASVISRNFRCKYFYYGKEMIVFYGFDVDASIAAETFKMYFDFGNKTATRYYNKCRRNGKNTKGVKNALLVGYLEGLASVLEKQSTALMVVTPQKVIESFEEKTKGYPKRQNDIRYSNSNTGQDAKAYGYNAGRTIAEGRAIEQRKAV